MATPEDDDECHMCGGEGLIFDCFDGCCEDAEIGCDACTRSCPSCGIKTAPAPAGLGEILSEALGKKEGLTT